MYNRRQTDRGLSEEKDNVTENKLRQEDEKEKGKKQKTDDRQADREVVWRGNI